MTEYPFLFYVIGTVTIVTGALVVGARNLVHAAFWTMPCFLSVAALFLVLENELLFTVQLLIYAGAIPITVLFVLMLTREVMSEGRNERGRLWPLAVAIALAFLLLAIPHIGTVAEPTVLPRVPAELTKQIGRGFLTGYLLPFEAASLMLLGSMIGAIYLARADRKKKSVSPQTPQIKEGDNATHPVAALADRRDDSV